MRSTADLWGSLWTDVDKLPQRSKKENRDPRHTCPGSLHFLPLQYFGSCAASCFCPLLSFIPVLYGLRQAPLALNLYSFPLIVSSPVTISPELVK